MSRLKTKDKADWVGKNSIGLLITLLVLLFMGSTSFAIMLVLLNRVSRARLVKAVKVVL